jgi:hypothetical protein
MDRGRKRLIALGDGNVIYRTDRGDARKSGQSKGSQLDHVEKAQPNDRTNGWASNNWRSTEGIAWIGTCCAAFCNTKRLLG